MLCRLRNHPDKALELDIYQFIQNHRLCGNCGAHFMLCPCKGMDDMNCIVNPDALPKPPANMTPADQLFRWHSLYQVTMGVRTGHPTELFLADYTSAVVHFASKHKEQLALTAREFVDSWQTPLKWDSIRTSLAASEKAFRTMRLKDICICLAIKTPKQFKDYVLTAAELFGGAKWAHMSQMHILVVRALIFRASQIPMADRQIMAGVTAAHYCTHVTAFSLPWLALDNSQQDIFE